MCVLSGLRRLSDARVALLERRRGLLYSYDVSTLRPVLWLRPLLWLLLRLWLRLWLRLLPRLDERLSSSRPTIRKLSLSEESMIGRCAAIGLARPSGDLNVISWTAWILPVSVTGTGLVCGNGPRFRKSLYGSLAAGLGDGGVAVAFELWEFVIEVSTLDEALLPSFDCADRPVILRNFSMVITVNGWRVGADCCHCRCGRKFDSPGTPRNKSVTPASQPTSKPLSQSCSKTVYWIPTRFLLLFV